MVKNLRNLTLIKIQFQVKINSSSTNLKNNVLIVMKRIKNLP